MSQVLSQSTLRILELVKQEGRINVYSFIKTNFKNDSYRKIYTHIYQLEKRGYLEKYKLKDLEFIRVSSKGLSAVDTYKREKDGKWKMIIFDIPESKRTVRDYLRTKLKQLGFKRWQNSIWITPYRLPDDVVSELKELSEKYFVRLITIESINNDSDLKKLF
ncbi:MAG: PaaX family transcriptional regulator, phenylacetic acid degradation operon negative regulatory [Candidatus Doudnabacteria bacterium]|nr:PaaX family transcriptional regulator, phenylacetic acid degradation operon negative regulatory [Candidatus Doudnabacteria bacterium]